MSELIKCECEPQFKICDINDYKVYDCLLLNKIDGDIEVDQKTRTFKLTGIMPDFDLFTSYTITCKETVHKTHGLQYKFVSYQPKKPSTSEEQRAYLSTLLTKLQVEEIFKVYDFPLDEIVAETFDYHKVKGLGSINYPPLKEKILNNFVLYDLLSELGKYNITYRQIKKIYEKYQFGEIALKKIKEDPYILYRDIDGIGFKKADKIAREMGIIDRDDPRRVRACVMFVLEENQFAGNTWIELNELEQKVYELIDNQTIEIQNILNKYNEFYFEDNKVALQSTYDTEKQIANELLRLKNTRENDIKNFDIKKFIEQQEKEQGFKYTEKQKELFFSVLDNGVNILTGAAGCGKTTELNGLLNMFDELGLFYKLASFSAKAAKVITELTGRNATTIHRLLGFTPYGFKYNKNNPLPAKIIIIDEGSFTDVWLFKSLLCAIKDNAILIVSGDFYQIESILAGNVLFDMIKSKLFNTCELDKVHRQALDSGIITIATACRQGKKFISNNEKEIKTFGNKKDAHILCGDKTQTLRNIVRSYKRLLQNIDVDVDKLIVLSPTRKGDIGTLYLNNLLQEIVNPKSKYKNEYKYNEGKLFRENDRVIHIKNNYYAEWLDQDLYPMGEECLGIFNGETGIIIKIIGDKVYVDYGDKIILYIGAGLRDLELSYALTPFKYQGSSCENVIFTFDSRHTYQMKRSLCYTGMTRASKKLVMCCDPKTLNYAIDNNVLVNKKTFLKGLLELQS